MATSTSNNQFSATKSTTACSSTFLNELRKSMRDQHYDWIRFSTYRTACKLRYLQRSLSFHFVDLWNLYEAFRENGLSGSCLTKTLEPNRKCTLTQAEMFALFEHIYYSLNRRLPSDRQVDVPSSVRNAVACCLCLRTMDVPLASSESSVHTIQSLTKTHDSLFNVFTVKITLALMCAGRLSDKMEYVFSQISDDHNQFIDPQLFTRFVRDALRIPHLLHESPSFPFQEDIYQLIFGESRKIDRIRFEEIFLHDPAPPCFLWLTTFHRLVLAENVNHKIKCCVCGKNPFSGFRYKCQRCPVEYQMCQDCFWTGRVTEPHRLSHDVKEYSYYKSAATSLLGNSLRRTLKCVPKDALCKKRSLGVRSVNGNRRIPLYDNNRRHPISAPTTPISSQQVVMNVTSGAPMMMNHAVKDEHASIRKMAARLRYEEGGRRRSVDSEDMLHQLEVQNRAIVHQICLLRERQQSRKSSPVHVEVEDPLLITEISDLQKKKEELEARMMELQQNRDGLVRQLESLLQLLAVTAVSPQPVESAYSVAQPDEDESAFISRCDVYDRGSSSKHNITSYQSMRNDLLSAADSLTSAMMSLVQRLNNEDEDGYEREIVSERIDAKDKHVCKYRTCSQ